MFFDISFRFLELGWGEPERRPFPSYDEAMHYAETEMEISWKPRFHDDVTVPIVTFVVDPVSRIYGRNMTAGPRTAGL